ncbi:MAG TPA: hypothetical protein VHT91_00445 [Kofleriaceae bacterium]|nr:hypothetical protein [Kofleriaceae bacterium]
MSRAMSRAGLAVAVLLAAAVAARPAAADPEAEAVALFDQGIKDMKAGHLEKACSELQASLQLVKDSGTKGALARCHSRIGRIASAWLLWRELSDTAPTAELRADAAAQAGKLERRLPKYTFKLAGPTPGLVVQVNGREVAVAVPVAVPVDPGTVAVTAVGRDGERATTKTWRREYTAVEGQTLAIEIPALEPLPIVRPPRDASPARPAPPAIDPELAASRHRRRVFALVLGGVALGAAGGGTVFGLQARSRYDDARRLCGGAINPCDHARVASAQHGVDTARRSALYADIAFGAGGAAAVAAVILWATAPSLESAPVAIAPSVTGGSLGLSIGGAF